MYTGDATTQDQDFFLVERHSLIVLVDGLKCSCGMASNPWLLHSFVQVRDITHNFTCNSDINLHFFVLRKATLLVLCRLCLSISAAAKYSITRGLAPEFLGGHYLLNQKYDSQMSLSSSLFYY